MSKCSSCGAEILWTVTQSGRRMPVDVKPVKRIVLKVNEQDALTPLSRVVDTFISHFSSCPNAKQHRSEPPKNE